MSEIRITNIQRMCFHDGPGLRTTVFLKGCNLHCPWCSNPENLSYAIEDFFKDGVAGKYGRDYCSEKLYTEIIKDKAFWGKEGGVTFSGGEALLQSSELVELFKLLKNEGINIAVETALFVPKQNLTVILEYIDHLIVDVKILDEKRCKDVLGGNLSTYLENVDYAYKKGKINVFRIPLCYEYTFNENNRDALLSFLKRYKDVPTQIFSVHNLGENKYLSLGMKPWNEISVKDSDVEAFMLDLLKIGLKAEVLKI